MNEQDKSQERFCAMCRENVNVEVIFKRKEGRCWLNKKGDKDCPYFQEIKQNELLRIYLQDQIGLLNQGNGNVK